MRKKVEAAKGAGKKGSGKGAVAVNAKKAKE
mgnify:CR=1 FL=1